jgi:hypothetical protein
MPCPARQAQVPAPPRFAVLAFVLLAVVGSGCVTAIPFRERPAANYVYQSGAPLRVAIIDETGDGTWTPSLSAAKAAFEEAAPLLELDAAPADANIVVAVRRYTDAAPPALEGYRFEYGIGGFAVVYDGAGRACNFPPSPLPVNCDGEITRAAIYLNDGLPPGADLEHRRERLVRHELGHALGLTRHSPDVDVAGLAARYGW